MFARSVIASAMLAALAAGGCSNSLTYDGILSELGARHEHVVETSLEEPEAIIAKAHAGDARLNPAAGAIIETRIERPYLLDTGDRLRIFVYGQPNLSRGYTVDHDGNVSVPLIGNVRARGLTTRQLEGALRSRLGQQYVKDPQVNVDVQQNRPFFILGEVRTPGQFPYVSGMTVEMAVAIAGGFGDRANERKSRVSRRIGAITEIIEVAHDFELEPGDTVYVYERFF